MAKNRLVNDVIVISGGTKGVGKAAAFAFAKEGAKVVFGGRDELAAKKILREIQEIGSQGIFVHTNLQIVSDCQKLFDRAFEKFGKIDGFFNYAGITPVSPLDTCDEKTFDDVMDINFKACFFCCQQAIKYMRKNGGGSIVLTGLAAILSVGMFFINSVTASYNIGGTIEGFVDPKFKRLPTGILACAVVSLVAAIFMVLMIGGI